MRNEIIKRYKIVKDVRIDHFERYEAVDQNTKTDVLLFQPDAGIRADSSRLAIMHKNIQATFQNRDAARFVKPRDFYPITEGDPCFYFIEDKPERALKTAIEETDLSLQVAISLLKQILDSVATIHREGFTHNNLTTSTILLTQNVGQIGARVGGLYFVQQSGNVAILPYNPAFAAPEVQIERKQIDFATDVYAVGVIAYMVLLGGVGRERAFKDLGRDSEGEVEAAAWEDFHKLSSPRIRRIDEVISGFPSSLANVVATMLAKPKEDRYKNAGEALAALVQAESEISLPRYGGFQVDPPQKPKPKPVSSKVLYAAAAVGALMCAIAFYKLFFSGPGADLVKQYQELAKTLNDLEKVEQITTFDESAAPRIAFSTADEEYRAGKTAFNSGKYDEAKRNFDSSGKDAATAQTALKAAREALAADQKSFEDLVKRADAVGAKGSPAYADATRSWEKARDGLAKKEYGQATQGFREANAAMSGLVQTYETDRNSAHEAKATADGLRADGKDLIDEKSSRWIAASGRYNDGERDLRVMRWKDSKAAFDDVSSVIGTELRQRYAARRSGLARTFADLQGRGIQKLDDSQSAAQTFKAASDKLDEADKLRDGSRFAPAFAALGEAEKQLTDAGAAMSLVEQEFARRRSEIATLLRNNEGLGGTLDPDWAAIDQQLQQAAQLEKAREIDRTVALWQSQSAPLSALIEKMGRQKAAAEAKRAEAGRLMAAINQLGDNSSSAFARVQEKLGQGDASLKALRWLDATGQFDEVIAAAEDIKKSLGSLEQQAGRARTDVEAKRAAVVQAGGTRMMGFAQIGGEAEQAFQAGDAARKSQRWEQAIAAYGKSRSSFEQIIQKIEEGRAVIEPRKRSLAALKEKADAVGATDLPGYKTVLADVDVADANAAAGRFDEAVQAIDRAENGLKQLMTDVTALSGQAAARRTAVTELRDSVIKLKPQDRKDFQSAEKDFAEANRQLDQGAFGRAVQRFTALEQSYRVMQRELDRMDCRVANGPEKMINVAPGRYDLGTLATGDQYRAGVGPRVAGGQEVNVDTEFCAQLDDVSERDFKGFLEGIDPARRAQIEGVLRTQLNDVDRPVVGIAYDHATDYAEWLSQKTGRKYRLPTPEEWLAVLMTVRATSDRRSIASFQTRRDWTAKTCDAVMTFTVGPLIGDYDVRGQCRPSLTARQDNQSFRVILTK